MVLDALAFLLESDVRALCRCCGSHFDLFNYAVDIHLQRNPGWWEELGEFEQADPVFERSGSFSRHCYLRLRAGLTVGTSLSGGRPGESGAVSWPPISESRPQGLRSPCMEGTPSNKEYLDSSGQVNRRRTKR